MNTRKCNAFTESVKKEEARAQQWEEDYYRSQNMTGPFQPEFQPAFVRSMPLQSVGRAPPPQAPPPQGPPYGNDSIYNRATFIGTPHPEPMDYPESVERRVTRQVEVPYTRQVRVPVKHKRIVPTKVQQRVKTKRLVEVPSFEEVNEEYTEIMDQPAVRNKEIWVKKVVPEHYMAKVPVKRTRKVTRPTTVIKEVDDYQVVEVDGSKAVEVDGYRIDEVQDTKLMEVNEVQNYRLYSQPDGAPHVQNTREVGLGNTMNMSRRMGTQVYNPFDEQVKNLPEDNSRFAQTLPNARASTSIPGRRSRRVGTAISRTRAPRPLRSCGFQLVDCNNANGVLVKCVSDGSAAKEAGINTNDIITRVNNRPTRSMAEFKRIIATAGKSTDITLNRRSMGNIKISLIR